MPTISAGLRVRGYDCHRRKAFPSTLSVPVVPERLTVVGREGEVPVGLEPADTGISRRALRVGVDDSGWTVHVDNTHGAVVHPWGQAPHWYEKGTVARHRWPRVGIRLVGSERTLEHWVLLESGAFQLAQPEPADPVVVASGTDLVRLPNPLTDTQLAAVRAVFPEHLAWPPHSGPVPVPPLSLPSPPLPPPPSPPPPPLSSPPPPPPLSLPPPPPSSPPPPPPLPQSPPLPAGCECPPPPCRNACRRCRNVPTRWACTNLSASATQNTSTSSSATATSHPTRQHPRHSGDRRHLPHSPLAHAAHFDHAIRPDGSWESTALRSAAFAAPVSTGSI